MSDAGEKKLRLAVVGCGMVSERFHAPAIGAVPGFVPAVMVDRDPARAAVLTSIFSGAVAESDYTTLAGRVDAAIVALPNQLNAKVSAELLRMGIPVLVEKPAALTIEDARMLLASQERARLAVGFIRREAVGIRLAKACIERGMLGEVTAFSVEDGYWFNWQAVNEFRFDRSRGGGILLDIGSHVFDTLSFWFGDTRVTRSQDDNMGGVETNVRAELTTGTGASGVVELSWTRELRNSAIITGTAGSLEVRWYGNQARLSLNGMPLDLGGAVSGDPTLATGAETFPLMFLAQLRRWHQALTAPPDTESGMAGAEDALRNIELIARCKEIRANMEMPWRTRARLAVPATT